MTWFGVVVVAGETGGDNEKTVDGLWGKDAA